jgi:hypothetical protein
MPGAKVVSGVNVLTAKSSPFGQFAITQIQSRGTGLQKWIVASGFDPFTDVTEMLAATPADGSHPGGFLAMTGTFNVDGILAAVSGKKNITIGTYGNATLLTLAARNGKINRALAFMGTSVAIAGDVATVKAALDQSIAGSSNSIDQALLTEIGNLSLSEDAWLVSSAPVTLPLFRANRTGRKGIPGQAAQILSSVQSFSAGLKFGPGAVLTADLMVDSAQNAAALGSVVQLGIGMASANAGSYPSKNPRVAVLLPLLQTAVITMNGNDVHLALSIPEPQLELLAAVRPGN